MTILIWILLAGVPLGAICSLFFLFGSQSKNKDHEEYITLKGKINGASAVSLFVHAIVYVNDNNIVDSLTGIAIVGWVITISGPMFADKWYGVMEMGETTFTKTFLF
jgi:hypothetical protein